MASLAANASDEICGVAIPASAPSPYLFMQETLVLEMYPPFAGGYKTRTIVLLTLLAGIIVLSLLYMTVNYLETRRKGREFWCWRVVERPAGEYVVLNQHIGYPCCSIVVAILWIVFTTELYRMFGGGHADPGPLFFYIPLCWIPFFCQMWATTFAVLSGANLASKGRKPNTHRFSPLLANTILIAIPLAMVIAISGVGIWTGIKWRIFARSWTTAHNAMGSAAEQWDGVSRGSSDPALCSLLKARFARFYEFQDSQYMCTIVYCLSAAVLIVINVVGGVHLLSTLRALGQDRIVPRNEPLVAPLQPFRTGQPPLETTGATSSSPINLTTIDEKDIISVASAVGEPKVISPGLKRLEWDVILFFIAVVPACTLFIGYSIWMTKNLLRILTNHRLYEFSMLGLIFIFSAVTFFSLLALTVKTSLSLYSSRSQTIRTLTDDTIEANLRRRAKRGKQEDGAGVRVVEGIRVVELKEVRSCYEDEEWTGGSTTQGSLYNHDLNVLGFAYKADSAV